MIRSTLGIFTVPVVVAGTVNRVLERWNSLFEIRIDNGMALHMNARDETRKDEEYG